LPPHTKTSTELASSSSLKRPFTSSPFATVVCLILLIGGIAAVLDDAKPRPQSKKCPSSPPPLGRAREKGRYSKLDAKQLIPETPNALVGCLYRSQDVYGNSLRLEVQFPVEPSNITSVLYATRTPLTRGIHGCPMPSFQTKLYLISGYAHAPDLVAWMRLYGCETVTNGTLIGDFTSPSTESRILAMLRKH
jgi:hypothetical protein